MHNIHFVSLFGMDLDYDIVTHWSKHYAAMNYDSYTVFLHGSEKHHGAMCGYFKGLGFTVKDAPEGRYTTSMRNTILDTFARSLDPLDYMVVADSDEFHSTGKWAANFRDLITSCDVLSGTLVDRWDDTLHEAGPLIPLDSQYPYAGDLFEKVFSRSEDPGKVQWRRPNRNKILAARAGAPVAHLGSHVLYKPVDKRFQREGCIVNHYKWRASTLDRLRTKWYSHEGFNQSVLEFFNVGQGVYA